MESKAQMEEEFKTQSEMVINKLKQHLKKEKEAAKNYKEQLIQAQTEKGELEDQIRKWNMVSHSSSEISLQLKK